MVLLRTGGPKRRLALALAAFCGAAPPGAVEVYQGLFFAEHLADPARQAEWASVAQGIDGVWLNLVGWPAPSETSVEPALRLAQHNRTGVVPVSVKQYSPKVAFSDSAVKAAEALERAGVFDWRIVALNGDAARNSRKEPFRVEAVRAARAEYPGKQIFVNVRIGEFRGSSPERILDLIEAADGATFEAEPRRFLELEGAFEAYANARRIVKIERKKPLIWLCPNGGMGFKETYLDELKQVYARIAEMDALPDIICIIGYGRTNGPLDELPEGTGDMYPSTLTGATRWMLSQKAAAAIRD